MAVLLFNDRGWAVATSAWSAGSKDEATVTICYQWGEDGISWFDSTGNARMKLNINMAEFCRRLSRAVTAWSISAT
jgi:hypothetical protein